LEKQTPDYCFDKIKSRRAGESREISLQLSFSGGLFALQIDGASCRIDKTPSLIDSRFPREAWRQLKSRDEPSEEFSDNLSIKHDVEEEGDTKSNKHLSSAVMKFQPRFPSSRETRHQRQPKMLQKIYASKSFLSIHSDE
jgi:hypothetical protein